MLVGTAGWSRRTAIMIHSCAAVWRLRTIMITITIPITFTITFPIAAIAAAAAGPGWIAATAAGLEVNGIAADGPLGAVLAGAASTAAGRIAIPLIIIIVRMPQHIRIASIGAGIQIHLGQRQLNQLTIALAMSGRIQAIVKALAHEALLVAAFAHTILDTLTGYGATHPMRRDTLAGQHTPEAGCNKEKM